MNRQTISFITIGVLVAATIGLLWWSQRPIIVVPPDAGVSSAKKKERASDTLLSDPRFQELRSRGNDIEIGPKGNPNPFEPFE